ncbi:AMP-binding protein [Actinomycetospora sp. OC33-EN08]|uniref:AMP-binding protein n=1 Tax=Actinomycetospora aurantiaca TaxID=3129233 RepID=A0ABU8MH02_9PSEU
MHDYDLADRTIGTILADKAARIGDRTFLTAGDRRWTYADAHRLTNAHAEGFRRAGVARGDHVALLLGNRPELLWALWGLGKLGAVAVPLNTAARGDLLVYLLDQSESSLLVAEDDARDRVDPAVARVPAVRAVLGPDDLARFADLPADDPPEAAEVASSDPHLIMYTSGTTGPSKGVVSPHSQGHAVGRAMTLHSGYRSDDVLYTCLPVFHANALWFTIYAALWAEATVALSPGFSARRFWSEVRASGATVFNALGAMANIIWQQPAGPADRDHAVRIAMVVPTSRELVEGFRERYGITVTSVFAMTENCAVTVFGPDDPPEKAASAGRVREVDVQIVDDSHGPAHVLPPGEVGEICVRPSERGSMMLGYHAMAEATVAVTRDLWFHTGDRGRLDADGYLYFSDRKKEAIRRRGENISAHEVETVLCRHPAVLEAAAVPVPSDLGEDDVMAWLVPAPGSEIDFAEVVAFCVEHMAYYMVPRYLACLEALPKTPSEKIEKYKLAVSARERLGELWDREAAGIRVGRP